MGVDIYQPVEWRREPDGSVSVGPPSVDLPTRFLPDPVRVGLVHSE